MGQKANKLIFFDLDGTLIDGYEYIYQHLWEYFGVEREQTRDVLRRYLRGDITYEDWVKNDVRLLKEAGATKSSMLKAVGLLRPMKGAVQCLTQLRERGYTIIVVSGGIDLVITAVFPNASELFDEVFINRYFFDAQGRITHAVPTPYDMEKKATCIKDMATKYHVEVQNCIFVGDNVNDIDAAGVAGTSIAFNTKSDELIQVTTHHVESNDLSHILPLIP